MKSPNLIYENILYIVILYYMAVDIFTIISSTGHNIFKK
jgi:hypothetical protein